MNKKIKMLNKKIKKMMNKKIKKKTNKKKLNNKFIVNN